MDRTEWLELQELFMQARALDGAAREGLLSQAAARHPARAAQVRSLLQADSVQGIMDLLAPRLVPVAQVLRERTPERLGPYRVVGELGRGGMGTVYLAERADGQFQQRVAIKLIDSTDLEDPQHQRFLAERQILAGLVHPHIARLLDGGVAADGRPYLVMEHVDGVPITSYCDAHGLDVAARLRLFRDVCAAVQHAHQNLVIHRDLKPSNILVSRDGRVHLLDFGIAKLLNPTLTVARPPDTLVEPKALTPEYASPEQVRGEPVTTASDIYSLGVLLHELLCGHPPYRLGGDSALELAAAVSGQEPTRPSSRVDDAGAALRGVTRERLARQLAGELDAIVLMALRKEPSRRYASADMLREDLDRALAGQAVLAFRGGRRYRLGRFVRRHRMEVTASLVVLVALVVALGTSVLQGRRLARERDRAARAVLESEGETAFLLELFRTGEPGGAPPAELSALQLLERGARRADELSDQPMVQARLLDVIGRMSLHLGRFDEAQRRLEQAVAIRRSTMGPSPDLASSLIHLSWVYRDRGERERAHTLVEEALEVRQRLLPPGHPDIAEAFFELGWLNGGPAQERLYRQAIALMADTGAAGERRISVQQALSTNLRRQGRLAEAVAADREALRMAERTFGSEHAVTGYAMIHLADHVRDVENDLAAAERLLRRGLELMERRYGDNSLRLIHGLNSLGRVLGMRDEGAEAERLARRALDITRAAASPEHHRVATQLRLLAHELNRQGRAREAEQLMHQAIELSSRTLGEDHSTVLNAHLPQLAEIYDRQGRYDEADRTFRRAVEKTPPFGVAAGELRRAFGRMLLRRRDYAAAEAELLASLELLRTAYLASPAHPNLLETQRVLAELYDAWGRTADADRYRVNTPPYTPY